MELRRIFKALTSLFGALVLTGCSVTIPLLVLPASRGWCDHRSPSMVEPRTSSRCSASLAVITPGSINKQRLPLVFCSVDKGCDTFHHLGRND